MGTIKDRNGEDLIKAEEIKKRWKEYRELNKKDLNDPDNHNGVVSHPNPEKKPINLVEVIKFQHQSAALNMLASLENPAVATGLEKVNLRPNSQEGQY